LKHHSPVYGSQINFTSNTIRTSQHRGSAQALLNPHDMIQKGGKQVVRHSQTVEREAPGEKKELRALPGGIFEGRFASLNLTSEPVVLEPLI
jgi:hypothetical protein